VTEAAVEAALRDLGRHVAWPPVPDLVGPVRAAVGRAEVPTLPRQPARRAVVLAAAALLVLGGLLAVSPGLRAAILRLFTLPGVRIEIQESTPPAPTSPGPEPLGREVSLAEARAEVGFPVAVPPGLGRPDEVHLLGTVDRALVTLAYRDRPGLPSDSRGYSALLTQLRGRPIDNLVKKVSPSGAVVPVTVDGAPGYFVRGPHLVYFRSPGGPVADTARLSGNSVLWIRGPVTLRLEVDLPQSQAVDLAATVG
jgi:hypothetical protein